MAAGFFAARTHDLDIRSEEHTSELQSQSNLVCRLLLEKKKKNSHRVTSSGGQSQRLTHRIPPALPLSPYVTPQNALRDRVRCRTSLPQVLRLARQPSRF